MTEIELLQRRIKLKRQLIELTEREIKELIERAQELARYQPHKHGKEKRT